MILLGATENYDILSLMNQNGTRSLRQLTGSGCSTQQQPKCRRQRSHSCFPQCMQSFRGFKTTSQTFSATFQTLHLKQSSPGFLMLIVSWAIIIISPTNCLCIHTWSTCEFYVYSCMYDPDHASVLDPHISYNGAIAFEHNLIYNLNGVSKTRLERPLGDRAPRGLQMGE